jgi:hypothetical protein
MHGRPPSEREDIALGRTQNAAGERALVFQD